MTANTSGGPDLLAEKEQMLANIAWIGAAAIAGEAALRAVQELRQLLDQVKHEAARNGRPLNTDWGTVGLILASVPSADTDLPATTTGGTR